MSYLELAKRLAHAPSTEGVQQYANNESNEISQQRSGGVPKQYENNEYNEISGDAPGMASSAQNAGAYLDSIALTTDMLDVTIRLAAAFPDSGLDQQEAAYGAYMSKAAEVKAWQRAAEVTDPDIAREFDAALRTRMFAIRDEWRAKRGSL